MGVFIEQSGGLRNGKLQVNVSTEGQGDQMLAEVDLGERSGPETSSTEMGGGLVYRLNYFKPLHPSCPMGGRHVHFCRSEPAE
jgi:hypothetical protein